MKRVLLTGFEPFDGLDSNPSEFVAQQLHDEVIRGHEITGATLACEFGKSLRQLRHLIRKHEPALVICLGLAGGRAQITPERVAINVDDARIPDNAGKQPSGRPVIRAGPVAYWSTLPVKAIVADLLKNGIPADVSQTAGTFVCNHVFYGLMHELTRHAGETRGGFIHLPPLADPHTDQTGLSAEKLLAGVRIVIATSLREKKDLREPSGSIA